MQRPSSTTGAGRPLACKKCNTYVTSSQFLLSSAYQGFNGKAALFRGVSTATTQLGEPRTQLMVTGAHTVRNLSCQSCSAYLGFEIVHAREPSEKWKEGHVLLELESIGDQAERVVVEGRARGRTRVLVEKEGIRKEPRWRWTRGMRDSHL